MKKLVFLLAALLAGTVSSHATGTDDKVAMRNAFNYGNSFIFVENGITFSVYPDGEFDFYIDNRVNVSAQVGVGPVGVTFNSGFDYNPFVQYDDYGAIIQVENVPVYYDFYGRVSQIGGVNILYRNGLAYRIGGMRVFYTPRGIYDYHTGFINVYNRVYVYRPWHRFFARPALGFCMVYNRPYRQFYRPIRYTYYRPYRFNQRRAYARVGNDYRYAPRAERTRIYQNDRRVSVRNDRGRYDGRVADRSRQDVRSNADRSRQEYRGKADSRRGQADNRAIKRSSREVRATPRGESARNSRSVTSRNAEARNSRSVTSRNTEARRPVPQRASRSGISTGRTESARRSAPVTRKSSPDRKAPDTRRSAPSREPQARKSAPARTMRKADARSGNSRRGQAADRSPSRSRSNGRSS